MAIKDMKTINVLNYNQNIVIVSTKHDSYTIEPAINSENPTSLPLSLDEILYINGNSAAFKTGILRFPKEIEKEMYEDYLRIPNWEDLLTIQDIEKIILHPTIEGLTKIINIKDTGMFDRVRGVFVRLKNTNDDDISLRVEKIIQARLDELRRGDRNTEIIIKAKDTVTSIATEEVDELIDPSIECDVDETLTDDDYTSERVSPISPDVSDEDETENIEIETKGNYVMEVVKDLYHAGMRIYRMQSIRNINTETTE